ISTPDLEWRAPRLDRNWGKVADLFYPRAPRPRLDRRLQSRQRIALTCCGDLYLAVALVSDPPGKLQLLRFLDDVPTKSDPLHPTVDLKMNAFHLELSPDAKESG